MKIFYFTGTGNSLYIAKRFGGELYSIPKVLKGEEDVFEDEKIGIIFPTYGFSVPMIVREFIEKITLKSPYIFAIMTCGNNNGDGAKWFTSFAKKHNIEIQYSNSIAMVGNHIPLVDIDKQKSLDKNIEENINDSKVNLMAFEACIEGLKIDNKNLQELNDKLYKECSVLMDDIRAKEKELAKIDEATLKKSNKEIAKFIDKNIDENIDEKNKFEDILSQIEDILNIDLDK